jgi:hypothetical protein
MMEVRPEFGSVLAPSLLPSVLCLKTTPNTSFNTVSFHHKHFRFIMPFTEYIFLFTEILSKRLTLKNHLMNLNGEKRA